MTRVQQIVLIVSFLLFSWLGMQAVHELGHIVGAWLTGGDVTRVVLHPLAISRTDLGHNRLPLVVVWAGPIVGVLLPLIVYMVAKAFRVGGLYLFRFFAAFCLLVNGGYIGFGPSEGVLDTAVMVRCGTPRWVMVSFGLAAIALGLYLMHGQGKYFGLGQAKGKVSRTAVLVSLGMLISVVGLELLLGAK